MLQKAIEILKRMQRKIAVNEGKCLANSQDKHASKLVSVISDPVKIVVDAAIAVAEKTDLDIKVDIDNIKVEKKARRHPYEILNLIKGIVLDKEVVHGRYAKKSRKGQDCSHQLCFRNRKDRD